MFKLFTSHTIDEHALSIASYVPSGRIFRAARDKASNLFKLLAGIGTEYKRAEDFLVSLPVEHDPRTTTDFIEEWEATVGIPDHCFVIADTLEERRNNVVIKLTALGAQTEQDFIDLAALLGFTITIGRYVDENPPPYTQADRFTWTIRGENIVTEVPEYDVEFIPNASAGGTIMQCLFDSLRPANTLLIFENT